MSSVARSPYTAPYEACGVSPLALLTRNANKRIAVIRRDASSSVTTGFDTTRFDTTGFDTEDWDISKLGQTRVGKPW